MSSSRRALTIAYDYFSCSGGAARVARAVDIALLDNGWKVDVLAHDSPNCSSNRSTLRAFGYDCHGGFDESNASMATGQYLSMAANILASAKVLNEANQYSLIIGHHYLVGLAFLNFSLMPCVRTVFICHGIRKNHFACYGHEAQLSSRSSMESWAAGSEAAMTDAMHVLESSAICSASKVSCVSGSVASQVRECWPNVAPEVIRNFYCLPSPPESDDHCSLLRVAPEQLVVLFVGRWERTKGCDVVAEIARRMAPDGPYLFVHAGEIIDLPLSPRVVHLGHLDEARLVHLYRTAALLLMPSRYEPYGLAAIEAMWYGTPVLAHRVGGLEDTVEEGATGWLLDSLDPDKWCAKIEMVLGGVSGHLSRGGVRAIARRRFAGYGPIERYLSMFEGMVRQDVRSDVSPLILEHRQC